MYKPEMSSHVRILLLIYLFCFLWTSSFGFVPSSLRPALRHPTTRTKNKYQYNKAPFIAIHGVVGGVALNQTKLSDAFASLGKRDQYDAVLTGLCAKILDETKDEAVKEAMEEPIALVQEMNRKRVKANSRSLMALIDAAVKTEDADFMANIMSLCLRNQRVAGYGKKQSSIADFPATSEDRVTLQDGSRKTRQQRLDDALDLPLDDRGNEILAALGVGGFVALSLFADFAGWDDITFYTNFLSLAIITVAVVDNFYDGLRLVGNQLMSKKKQSGKAVNLPDKDDLPLGLGSGQVTGGIMRGLTRLSTVDTERESQCEAAAFYAAYTLGLPCFAFRPNALEGAGLVLGSMNQTSMMEPLLTPTGILKMLVWLMAPVAMESSKHPFLIMSDPREGFGLLKRLEDQAELIGGLDQLFWLESEQEQRDLLKWAYNEAEMLLRGNRDIVKELSEGLASGAATVGDCVAIVEDW